jgi:hypothetical protein
VAGWSVGTGAAALGGLGAVVIHGLVAQAPLAETDFSLVVYPVAGLVGGAVTGATAGALQLAGGRPLARLRWVAANCIGGGLTGVPLLYAFTTHANGVAMVAVFAACAAAGLIWGALVAACTRL